MSDIIDKEIAAITQRIRAAENDFAHARHYDPGHPNTERLRRQIVADKQRIVGLAEQRARTRSADELNTRNNSVFWGGNF
jgi:hypothetical protein